jgi:hypothetical protein
MSKVVRISQELSMCVPKQKTQNIIKPIKNFNLKKRQIFLLQGQAKSNSAK